MLYLKTANLEDWEEEYRITRAIPAEENGLENPHHHDSAEEFRTHTLPKMIKNAAGEQLPDGFVPCTTFFIWDNDRAIGFVKLRHRLSDALKIRGGHIGFTIDPTMRGQGYATQALALAIDAARKIIAEDHILMSVRKDNPASLRVQQKNGAKIIADKGDYYLTRIDL